MQTVSNPQLAGTANHLSAICLNPVPSSYIRPEVATARINNYRHNKLHILTDWIRTYEHQADPAKQERLGIRYSRNEFMTLTGLLSDAPQLSGLRVYFASYTRTGHADIDQYIPAGAENLMTLIFSATQAVGNDHIDSGHFFILSPDSTESSPKIVRLTPPSIKAFPWVLHYESKAIALQSVSTNRPMAETRSVWFEGRSFLDWAREILCMELHGVNVNGVFLAFAAYNADETVLDAALPVGHQLTLIITTDPDFPDFPEPASFFFNMEKHLFFKEKVSLLDDEGFDTSVPCPPAVCG
jgi:hypothetical protein